MSDRNKMALLCVLIVLAFSVWTRTEQEKENLKEVDIFQESRRDDSANIWKNGDSARRERFLKMRQTCDQETERVRDPFE